MAFALFDDNMPPLIDSTASEAETDDGEETDEDWIPAMPTVDLEHKSTKHRERYQRPCLPACVAQPISKHEMKNNIDAQAACRKEWDTMRHKRKVWRDCTVRNRPDVVREAKRAHRTVE